MFFNYYANIQSLNFLDNLEFRKYRKGKKKHTVWSSELDTLLMRYGIKFTSYGIKSVSNSLDQTVDINLQSQGVFLFPNYTKLLFDLFIVKLQVIILFITK